MGRARERAVCACDVVWVLKGSDARRHPTHPPHPNPPPSVTGEKFAGPSHDTNWRSKTRANWRSTARANWRSSWSPSADRQPGPEFSSSQNRRMRTALTLALTLTALGSGVHGAAHTQCQDGTARAGRAHAGPAVVGTLNIAPLGSPSPSPRACARVRTKNATRQRRRPMSTPNSAWGLVGMLEMLTAQRARRWAFKFTIGME